MSPLTLEFLDHSADPENFGHEQHVQVAYDLLNAHDFLEATVLYVNGIRTLATNAGQPDKFHMTVTLAYLSVIAERMASSKYTSFEYFLKNNRDLLSTDALTSWYGHDRLNTALARTQFVLPEMNSHQIIE